jgi:hypothetical protein
MVFSSWRVFVINAENNTGLRHRQYLWSATLQVAKIDLSVSKK